MNALLMVVAALAGAGIQPSGLRPVPTRVAADTPAIDVDTAAITRFLTDHLRRTGVPGAAIAIVSGGRIVHLRGYGRSADGSPVSGETPMRIASLSKSFAALAVMQLVQAGRIRLDAPVRTYLASFAVDDPRGPAITVRHLLHQTTGLTDATFHEMSLNQPESLGDAVTRLRRATLAADPGTDWNYHNSNYHLAAAVVEAASGEPYASYLRDHVFQPLGMSRSRSAACGAGAATAQGHIVLLRRPIALKEPPFFCTGSGDVVSTAHDMARWLLLQSGQRPASGVISDSALTTMHTPSAASPIYGMGWYNTAPAGGAGPVRVSHSGVTATYSAYQGIFPTRGYGVAVLQNASSPFADPYTIASGLVELLDGRIPRGSTISGEVVFNGVVALLTILTIAFGVRGWRRGSLWAERARTRRPWRNACRLIPYVIPAAVLIGLVDLTSAMMGRDGNWTMAWYIMPMVVVFVGVGSVTALSVAGRRLWLLWPKAVGLTPSRLGSG